MEESVLASLPLRRGKWTAEEQNYSELLIQYFLAGVVPKCADGTTLRAFLSAKLHCAPMRITKKFAGATLGKSIFYRTGHLEDRELTRLRDLESRFVASEESSDAILTRPQDDEETSKGDDDVIAESAAVVAAHAKAAANAAMRAAEAPPSTWAARVAEGAALVTAARRDAELRAARVRFSGDADADVARAAVRAAEAASLAATKLSADHPEDQTRQILLRAIDKLGDTRNSPRDELEPLDDDDDQDDERLDGAAGDGAKPPGELYSELYDWVPPNLGVTASADEIYRKITRGDLPDDSSQQNDDRRLGPFQRPPSSDGRPVGSLAATQQPDEVSLRHHRKRKLAGDAAVLDFSYRKHVLGAPAPTDDDRRPGHTACVAACQEKSL